jgi:predicted ArsR family transcriptional regulator
LLNILRLYAIFAVMDEQPLTPLERTIRALGDGTRRAIFLDFLDDPRDRTVDEVASAVGVHRTAAFNHLERLAELGYLAADRRRGTRGKPAKVYRLRAGAVELSYPPRLHRHLAGLLASAIGRLGGAGRAASREVGLDFGRSLARPAQDVREALGPVEALGGRYVLESPDVLVADNCVFQEACQESRAVVCGVHAGMLEGALTAAGHPRGVAPLGPRTGRGCAFVLEAR